MATMPARGGTAAAWITIAASFVALYEGFSGTVYLDSVRVRTICYGQTADDGANFAKTYSRAECMKMLGTDLDKYDKMVHKCIKVPLPPHREAAIVSFTYNLGPGALCSGQVARDINAGNSAAGCKAMLRYNHAGGRVLKGLTRRREAEYRLCMRDD
jgi:lysozyme